MGKKKACKVVHNCIRIERLAVPVKMVRAVLRQGVVWKGTGKSKRDLSDEEQGSVDQDVE